jgi:hypothetical protein
LLFIGTAAHGSNRQWNTNLAAYAHKSDFVRILQYPAESDMDSMTANLIYKYNPPHPFENDHPGKFQKIQICTIVREKSAQNNPESQQVFRRRL